MQFKVMKAPVKDGKTGKELNKGDIVELTLKRVKEFEEANGKGWFERIEENG